MADRLSLSRRRLLGGAISLGLAGGLGRGACAGEVAGSAPRRIVVLDWGLAASCTALGRAPVGVPAPGWCDRYVGAPALPAGVVDVGLLFTPNFELLQELKPDAILATAGLEAVRPLLERVAPVQRVALDRPGPGALDRAAVETRRLAGLLGLEAAGEALAARTETALAESRAALAPLAGQPVLLVSILDQRHVNVFGASSLHHEVLLRLGLRNGWGDGPTPGEFVTVGLERLASLPEARLVNIALGGIGRLKAMAASPFWQALPFAREGCAQEIGSILGSAGLPAAERLARLLAGALAPEAPRGRAPEAPHG